MATNWNIDQKRQYLDQQNMMNQGMQGLGLGQGMSALSPYARYKHNPLEGYDLSSFSKMELENMLMVITQEYERKTMDTPLKSPTQRMLNKNEALKHAWSEFMTIWKLTGVGE